MLMPAYRPQKNFALEPQQRADARAALADLPEGMTLADCVRIAKLGSGIAIARKTVREVAALFITDRERGDLRGSSVSWYESKLKPILGVFGGDDMDSVTREKLERCVGALPVSQSTKAAHYRAARALWRWAKAQAPAMAGRDVTEGIKVSPPKSDSDGAEFLPVADVAAIMANLPPYHRPAAALLFFAGIRPQEVAGNGKPPMLWRHVDPVAQTISIEASIAKTRSRRVLQGLPGAVWPWLMRPPLKAGETPETQRIARCSAQQLIRMIQQAGGFWTFAAKGRDGHRKRKTAREWPHDVTRHTFASYYIAAFDDPGKCALLMGHGGNPRMLYTHYLGLATKADALKFWGIAPPN